MNTERSIPSKCELLGLVIICLSCLIVLNGCGLLLAPITVPTRVLLVDGPAVEREYQQEQLRVQLMREQMREAFAGRDCVFHCAFTVETEHGTYEFMSGTSGLRSVRGVTYIHGVTRGGFGAIGEYLPMAMDSVRSVSWDMPIRLLLVDGSAVTAEEGAWLLRYAHGGAASFEVTVEADGVERSRAIPVGDVVETLPGEDAVKGSALGRAFVRSAFCD